nr:auxin-responsive protein SAUR72-like [Ipomoea batatas]
MSATPAGSSNKIRDIVRLRQLLKKWKKLAATNSAAANATATATATTKTGTGKSINKFLKKTLSFSDVSAGCLAVQCVEKSGEVKRFVIPTEYLAHDLFGVLLREAEEEFGFQTEGILKIPCEFAVFEKILKAVQQQDGKRPPAPAPSPPQQPIFQLHDLGDLPNTSCYSPDAHAHHPAAGIPPQTQMCR